MGYSWGPRAPPSADPGQAPAPGCCGVSQRSSRSAPLARSQPGAPLDAHRQARSRSCPGVSCIRAPEEPRAAAAPDLLEGIITSPGRHDEQTQSHLPPGAARSAGLPGLRHAACPASCFSGEAFQSSVLC
uniref:Uncharacterized protein n=1 Tax=Sphaerodactylus townsendi TaxID=933632 RepID=A0ACB8EPK0_9SAUR